MSKKSTKGKQADSTRPRSNRGQNLLLRPSDESLRLLGGATARAQNRHTAIRQAFIARPAGAVAEDPAPLLADVLSTPKTGGFRLKLYLALLWQAGGGDERHSVNWPARSWAGLLDLPDPEAHGDRRVRAALQDLRDRELITLTTPPGRPTLVALQRDDGEGGRYTHPGEDARAIKEKGDDPGSDLYVQLPPTYWSRGWGVALSGPAVAMLLVLLDWTNNASLTGRWISPSLARTRYGLTEDTWSRGVGDLSRWGIIEIGKKQVQEDFGWRRVRNSYTVKLARLDGEPAWQDPAK